MDELFFADLHAHGKGGNKKRSAPDASPYTPSAQSNILTEDPATASPQKRPQPSVGAITEFPEFAMHPLFHTLLTTNHKTRPMPVLASRNLPHVHIPLGYIINEYYRTGRHMCILVHWLPTIPRLDSQNIPRMRRELRSLQWTRPFYSHQTLGSRLERAS